jgi:mRNA interferase ChpB|tara:strand:- start:98 stop:439 length:342 start_codon:yes stop_codon:yes gene_type:complete
MAIFDRGDIVRACLNPIAGNEMQGDFRPCLVLSPKAFNKLGLTLIAPITQGGNFARFQGFSVSLMGTGTETQGVILVNGVRSVDLKARKAKKVESLDSEIVNEALAILSAILD